MIDSTLGSLIQEDEKFIDWFHDLGFFHMVFSRMHEVFRHFNIRVSFFGKFAAAVIEQSLDSIHGNRLDIHQAIRVGLCFLEFCKLLIGETQFFHQRLKRNLFAIGARLLSIGRHEIPVDSFVVLRTWLFAVANRQHIPVQMCIRDSA